MNIEYFMIYLDFLFLWSEYTHRVKWEPEKSSALFGHFIASHNIQIYY